MRELQLVRANHLAWRERPDPVLSEPRDAIVRPFVAGRCDGDTMPIHRHVSRAMQVGLRAGFIAPVVASICGDVPFRGPFGIGHEIGVSHVRPHLPDLLDFIADTEFPAETVTTLLADWDDAPEAYRAHTTKLVLHRAPLGVTA